jgi:hypothetical protein
MPIKQFSNPQKPGMVIGALHKGSPKTDAGMGKELPYWRFSSTIPGVEEAFLAAYGAQPTKISVYFPFATPDDVFSYWCEVWSASSLQHRCDGETATLWREGSNIMNGHKPCPGGHKDNNPLNDSVGRMVVIVPELVQAGFAGYVTVQTKGKNDILHIVRVLQEAYEIRKDNPLGLRGIRFDLCRVKESISAPGFGKTAGQRTHVDKYNIKLYRSIEFELLQIEMARRDALSLPAGEIIEPPEELEEGEIAIPDEVREAMEYKTKDGRALGSMTDSELEVIVTKCQTLQEKKESTAETDMGLYYALQILDWHKQ